MFVPWVASPGNLRRQRPASAVRSTTAAGLPPHNQPFVCLDVFRRVIETSGVPLVSLRGGVSESLIHSHRCAAMRLMSTLQHTIQRGSCPLVPDVAASPGRLLTTALARCRVADCRKRWPASAGLLWVGNAVLAANPDVVLQTATSLEDAEGTGDLAAKAADYIRRNLRVPGADAGAAPDGTLSLLSGSPPLHPLPAPLTARLEALSPAAANSIAQHLLVSEAPHLPPPLRAALLRKHLSSSAGALTLTAPAATSAGDGADSSASTALPRPDTTDTFSSLLELCAEVLPRAADGPALETLSLRGDFTEAAARRVLASGGLGLTTLQEINLDVGRLPESTVAAIVGEVSAATALSLRNLALTAAAAAGDRREGAGESFAVGRDSAAAGAGAGAPEGLAGLTADGEKRLYDRDPSPGRPQPFPLLLREPMRPPTADEVRTAALAEAIGTLTALQRLTLHPAPSAGRRFWSSLEGLGALSALDVALYGGTDDSSSRSGSPDPPDGSAPADAAVSTMLAEAAAHVGEPSGAARGLVDAQDVFLRLQEVTGLCELQVHSSGFSERAEEVRRPALISAGTAWLCGVLFEARIGTSRGMRLDSPNTWRPQIGGLHLPHAAHSRTARHTGLP